MPSIDVLGQSVLATGDWAKLGVTSSGIYKIDFNLLQTMGFDPNTIDPNQIQVYGQGGGMLPQDNSANRAFDLVENALYGVGLDDGSFDVNDYLLFYAQGPNKESFNPDGSFSYQKNYYADTTYYFLTVSDQNGKRMQVLPDLGNSHPQVNTFSGYQVHELDVVNILSSGREWYGESLFNNDPVEVTFSDMPILAPGSELRLVAAAVNKDDSQATLSFDLNGVSLGSFTIGGVGSATYDPRGVNGRDTLAIPENLIANNSEFEITANYQAGGGSGNLDYLVLLYEGELSLTGNHLFFRSPEAIIEPTSTYMVGNATSESLVLDLTNPQDPSVQTFQLVGDQAVFGAESSSLKQYVILNGANFPVPSITEQVTNQNIKGYETPQLLIITHQGWRAQAEQLAAFRAQNDQLSVSVVTPEEIYNEFSSGAQDVTAIRDYLKYLYEKDPVLKYVLLFGRCSYDYKNVTNNNSNFVPTYESRNSLDPIFSHNSDDYFTFLDADEGSWEENLSGTGGHLMDISVGRLPVSTPSEAQVVVDKLIHYATNPATLGSWRQDIYYVADDGDFNLHQRDADQLATMVDTASQDFNVNKIFLDAFPQEQTPNGESAQTVNQMIDEAVKKGALIINYTGHGSEFRWADETILNQNMIANWDNYDRLPFFVTATCEFGRHDDPVRISGAEKLITNPQGGAIGLVTTARPVFASKNFILNKAFYEVALNSGDEGYPTLGEIFQFVKNDSYTIVANRNFVLLGDPSMKLAYPQNNLIITDIERNQQSPGDTVQALSLVRIAGEVVDPTGTPINSYQGSAEVTVFDKATVSETLGSDGGRVFTFQERNSVIFRGLASITAGKFEVNFRIPKNINYQIGKGKISLYGVSESGLVDAGGATISFVIGGSNKDAPVDNTPPVISLYMDDTSFRNGGSTGKNTMLIAEISDENGINISNIGFGQDITADLNKEQSFILNDFYRADVDSYQSGTVNYPLSSLEEGNYTITLKAWDVYNNSNESSLDFVVVENPALALHRVLNYPNPFQASTTFQIDHNRAGSPLEVAIFIYDQKGQLVRTLSREFSSSPSSIDGITWQGTNSFGTPLKSGLYLYKVVVKSTTNGDKSEEYRKLVLIK